jgi:ATP-binding cassette subfamily B protein
MPKNTLQLIINFTTEYYKSFRSIFALVGSEIYPLAILRMLAVASLPLMRLAQSGFSALTVNELVKSIKMQQSTDALYWYGSGLVIATLIPIFLYPLGDYLFRQIWFLLDQKIQMSIVSKLAELDNADLEDPKTQDLIRRIDSNGVWKSQNIIDRQFYLFENILDLIITVAILSISDWWLMLILIIGTFPEFWAELKFGREVWGIWNSEAEVQRHYWDIRWRFYNLAQVVEMRLFQSKDWFIKRLLELYLNFRNKERKAESQRIRRLLLSRLPSVLVIALVTGIYLSRVIDGTTEIGTFLFIFQSIIGLRSGLSSLFQNLAKHSQDMPFVKDVLELLDKKIVLSDLKNAINLPNNITPRICFKSVDFSYPSATSPSLRNINLTIEPGEKLAIIGLNGAGKSTFVKLLCRFYDPSSGSIEIDATPLNKISRNSWYSVLGVIFQDYAQYKFKVSDAISLGNVNREINMQDVIHAAKQSGADDFINTWESSYEQQLGPEFTNGKQPSIGQWQKLALARLFYRNSRIMVLDEPTSSIDAEAEEKIFEQLETTSKDKTVILISHRFSTVRRADRIVVFEDGTISELGNHDQLIAQNGTYARLFNLQAKGYK